MPVKIDIPGTFSVQPAGSCFPEIKCNGMTSFMEFMIEAVPKIWSNFVTSQNCLESFWETNKHRNLMRLRFIYPISLSKMSAYQYFLKTCNSHAVYEHALHVFCVCACMFS